MPRTGGTEIRPDATTELWLISVRFNPWHNLILSRVFLVDLRSANVLSDPLNRVLDAICDNPLR